MAGSRPPENTLDIGGMRVVEGGDGEEVGGVEVAVELGDLPDGCAVGVALGEDGGEEAVVEGGGGEVPDLVGVGEQALAEELAAVGVQADQVDLVLLFEAESGGEEAGVIGVGFHIGNAASLVFQTIAYSCWSSLHISN